jgi:hypothetical protein
MSKKIIISESERKKILSLYGIINEAAEDDKFEIKAQNYFAPGYHSNLNSKIKQSITQQLLSAKNFLKRKEKEGKVVFIKIISSESAVPNHDNEVTDKPDVPTGWLRERRADTMKEYISSVLEGWTDLITTPPFEPFVFSDPTEAYKEGDNKQDPRFNKDIWVKVEMEVKPADSCLVGLGVQVLYNNTPDPKFPCRGNHNCDEAFFRVKLNGVVIGNVNLGNYPNGRSVTPPVINVTQQYAEQIAKNAKDGLLTLSLLCPLDSCHSSTPEIKIYKDGAVIIHTCTSLMVRNDKSEVTILVLDLCGNIIPKKNDPANAGTLDPKSILATKAQTTQTTKTTQTSQTEKKIYVHAEDDGTVTNKDIQKLETAKLIIFDKVAKKYKWIGNTITSISSKNSKHPSQTINKGDILDVRYLIDVSVPIEVAEDEKDDKYNTLLNSGKIIKQTLGTGITDMYIWVGDTTSVKDIFPDVLSTDIEYIFYNDNLVIVKGIKSPSF